MKRALLAVGVAYLATVAVAQDANIHDVKFKHEKAIRSITGVTDVSVAGVNGQMSIVVRVENSDARDAVVKLCGGKLEGHPVKIIVSAPAAAPAPAAATAPAAASTTCANCQCPCHRKTVAEERKPEPKIDLDKLEDKNYQAEKCDVMREWLGLPVRHAANGIRCQQMLGTTNDPEKIKWINESKIPTWQSKEMPNMVCYSYIRHRQFCPLGMKQILQDIDKQTPEK